MILPTPDAWTRVDRYLSDALVGEDTALREAVADQRAAGLPAIEVAPLTGKFLHLMVRLTGARRVLEIGTLGGYSAIWMARALPEGGEVVTVEAEPAGPSTTKRRKRDSGCSTAGGSGGSGLVVLAAFALVGLRRRRA